MHCESIRVLRALSIALAVVLLCACSSADGESGLHALVAAQAVRGEARSFVVPGEGWDTVQVPDFWQSRWQRHDGVVWYRLQWNQVDATQPAGVLIEYLNMAGAVYVNGTLLQRDASLVEPLSRAWNTPRFFSIEPPLLRAGSNELVLRVSGLAAYAPGIGRVWVGPESAARNGFDRLRFVRYRFPAFAFAVTAALGCFFLILWLMRRREVAFGWYAASALAWLAYDWNFIAPSAWPLNSTYLWQSLNAFFLFLFASAFMLFVLRICVRRFPRGEALLWLGVGIALLAALVGPALARNAIIVCAALLVLGANALLVLWAWRGDKVELRMLSGIALLYVVAGVHDLLAYLDIVRSNNYYADITAFTNTLCIAAVLAWRYARSMERVENFNLQLQRDVAAARTELAGNLAREHATEMAHARIGERLNLVRDIHDGIGGSLLGNISAIERAPEKTTVPQLLKLLKELRDELRLIIDTAVIEPANASGAFAEQLAPLRQRMTRLLDANGIVCRWDVSAIETLRPASAQALDVLRFVQEALTNVLKHSGASAAWVSVRAEDRGLAIEVRDNGKGIGATPGQGAGTSSMQARAQRLGGQLMISSRPGQTCVAIVGALPTPSSGACASPNSPNFGDVRGF